MGDVEYEHALNLWRLCGMSSMQDYHDLYLMTDVLLFADAFENFRVTAIEYDSLDI